MALFPFVAVVLLFWPITTAVADSETCEASLLQNSALVFVKPHANTPAVRELVRRRLEGAGLTIESTHEIMARDIDRKELIDKHYYSIASKATLLSPTELVVPVDKFRKAFGEEWQTVLEQGRAANALQACQLFGCSPDELNVLWDKAEVAKLGGGFYCGKVANNGKELYVFNAFFLSMRSKFVQPGASIYAMTVSWYPSQLSWQSFRQDILGATDPAEARKGSLRRTLLDNYDALGLESQPSKSDNGVHASASPLEGLGERCNWLGARVERDAFGKAILEAGISKATLQAWILDAVVALPEGRGSIFDALEDLDVAECLQKIVSLNQLQTSV